MEDMVDQKHCRKVWIKKSEIQKNNTMDFFLKFCQFVHSWPGREILNLKSKQKHFEVGWRSRKGGCWDCFLSQNDLMAFPSFNFIALLHKSVVNSSNCGPAVYLCATTFYICARFYFIFVRKLLSAICGAITRLISLHTSSGGSINATSMTMNISDL